MVEENVNCEFIVPVERLNDLKERISYLNKRAKKIGCEPIVITIGATSTEKMKRDINLGDGWTTRTEHARCVRVTVAGSPPQFAGWTFLGSIQLIDGENIVRAVPGASIPVEYRKATDWCDHCKSHRGRKDVFVLQHESRETKVVGRNCIRDFLGHETPESILWRATFLTALRDDLDGFCKLAGGDPANVPHPLEVILAGAARAIRCRGFHKVSQYPSTKNDALDILFGVKPQFDKYGKRLPWRLGIDTPPPVEDVDRETSAAAIEWALEIPADTTSDYLYNVRALATNGTCIWNTMGIAVSVVQSFLRAKGLAEERRMAAETSSHFGTVGKREVFELTVTKVVAYEGLYGGGNMHIMVDDAGNVAKWASTSLVLEPGKRYKLKGTVKKHDNYKGAAQTVLSRCSIA